MKKQLISIVIFLLLSVTTLQNINLATNTGFQGIPFQQLTCNSQTIIDFKFNSSSVTSSTVPSGGVSIELFR